MVEIWGKKYQNHPTNSIAGASILGNAVHHPSASCIAFGNY